LNESPAEGVGETSRPEAAFVLMLLQSVCWLIAGLSAAPFALGGELFMAALSAVTLVFALFTCLVAIGIVWRRRWAWRVAMTLEIVSVLGAAALIQLPIGSNQGPVSLLVNVVLPLAVIALLGGRRQAFS
jgi:hypothetical protein